MKKYRIIDFIAIFLIVIMSLPVFYLLVKNFGLVKIELKSSLIIKYLKNTLIIVLSSGLLTVLIGSSLAWIVSFYDFKYRKLFKVILALPLAIPPYIAAYGYGDFFYHQGLFHKFLLLFNIDKYYDILNIYGVIFIYSITLYPYIYLICLSYFSNIDRNLIDSAKILKANFLKTYFKIGLPIARVAIFSGLILVIMEIISDFGVVDYYGVGAFSSGIYKLWFNYNNFDGAIRLSAIALMMILFLIVIEDYYLKKKSFAYTLSKSDNHLISVSTKVKINLYLYLMLIVFVCLLLPILQLVYNASFIQQQLFNFKLLHILQTTIFYCLLVAIISSLIAFLIASYSNRQKSFISILITKLSTLGYSIPGVIIALAVIFGFVDLDYLLGDFYRLIGILDKKLVLSTSLFILLFAYVLRFLAIGYNNLTASYKKVNTNLFMAIETLKVSHLKSFFQIELALLYPSILISIALVFLEVLKELPITLILKPYKIETLTSTVHTYLYNEQHGHASFMSLIIIGLGFIVVLIIIFLKEKQNVKSR